MNARERRVRELIHGAVEHVRSTQRGAPVTTDADIAARHVAETLLPRIETLEAEVNRYAKIAARRTP